MPSRQPVPQGFDDLVKQADDSLLKELNKLLNRIERLMVPTYFYSHCKVATRLSVLRQQLADKEYFVTTTEFTPENIVKTADKSTELYIRRVDWERLEADLREIIGNHPDDAYYLKEVSGEIEHLRRSHEERYHVAVAKEKIRQMQVRNNQPAIMGKWRKDAFPPRTRVQLTDYVATDSISAEEGAALMEQLNTPLNGYVGQAYNYDDRGLTEEWMTSFRSGATAASEDEVARTQLVSLMEIMMSKVQDRIYNEEKILEKPPIVLSKDVVEQPVWGIDSYTRRMIEICLEDRVPQNQRSTLTIKDFIEHILLPAINRQSPDKAHNLSCALQSIIDDSSASVRDQLYAQVLMACFHQFGFEIFKIHPKGTGVVCINPEGIPPQVLIAEYLGELYPAYRWCERLDVIEQAQKELEMKPTLPDFYNILLERPRQDPNGYGLLYVDASQKANIGSSCSHSCDANCTSSIVARNGRLTIAMTTNRQVRYGEELTFDYYSITTSDVEWRASVCLCGMTSCRGSFLAYATQDDLQQVLNQNFGPVSRYASLLRACAERKPTAEDAMTLSRHGIKQAILGSSPPNWITKYAADILRFVEFERKALPCALLRPRNGISTEYTFSGADMDARCVMEQRIQSMVCCFSMINRVLTGQQVTAPGDNAAADRKPLQPVQPRQVMQLLWSKLQKIPKLVDTYFFHFNEKTSDGKSLKSKMGEVEEMLQLIQDILKDEPSSMAGIRESCIKIRRIIANYQHLSHGKARLLQLADVLALWAYTVNFSVAQEYEVVEAASIEVPARELGSTVPRTILQRAKAKERDRELQQRRKQRRLLAELEYQLYDPNIVEGVKKTKPKKSTSQSIPTALETTNLCDSQIDIAAVEDSSFMAEDFNTTHESVDCSMDVDEDMTLSKSAFDAEPVSAAAAVVVTTTELCDMDMDIVDPTIVSQTAEHSTTTTENTSVANVEVDLGPMIVDAPIPVAAEAAAVEVVVAQSTKPAEEQEEETTAGAVPEAVPPSHESEAKIAAASPTDAKRSSFYLDPNEPVFTGRKVYDKWFCFWQLMDWFNAGTDQKSDNPDLFGCVELPDPSTCFGTSSSMYTSKHQEMLINILKDDKLQAMNWPLALKSTFNLEEQAVLAQTEEQVFGSPMLDVVLGQIDSVSKSLREILSTAATSTDGVKSGKSSTKDSKKASSSSGKSSKKSRTEEEERQLDEILAPEAPTSWVQCDQCNKWRRVPWHVDLESLPDPWICTQNTWDIDAANCEAPQDAYDASKENAMYSDSDVKNLFTADDFVAGSWWDVFCVKNLVYYEAQALKVKIKKATGSNKKDNEAGSTHILFHYKGWSRQFDEWVSLDSERICRHNLFTNPMASDPREQERWQGMEPVAFKYLQSSTKKRKSSEGQSTEKVEDNATTTTTTATNSAKKSSKSTTPKGKKATVVAAAAATTSPAADVSTDSPSKRTKIDHVVESN